MNKRFLNIEAIVIRKINYKDSDKIFTFLTRDFGKLTALAKGVRKIRSKKASHLDTANKVKIQLARGKNFFILTGAQTLKNYDNIKKDLVSIKILFEACEIVNKITREGQDLTLLYRHLSTFLDESKEHLEEAYLDFLINLTKDAGFWNQKFDGFLSQKDKPKQLELLKNYLESLIERKIKSRQLRVGPSKPVNSLTL